MEALTPPPVDALTATTMAKAVDKKMQIVGRVALRRRRRRSPSPEGRRAAVSDGRRVREARDRSGDLMPS